MGYVDYKHVLEISVRPGAHTIKGFNRILHSKPIDFEIKPGERVTFQVANVGGFLFKFFMMLCMGIPTIRLTREAPEEAKSPKHSHSRRSLR